MSKFDFVSDNTRGLSEDLRGELQDRIDAGKSLIPYGVSLLDDYTLGIARNDLVMIGSYSGAGKTQLASLIAENAARVGKRVLFIALEAEDREVPRRIKYRHVKSIASHDGCTNANLHSYREWSLGLAEELDRYSSEADRAMLAELGDRLRVKYRGSGFTGDDLAKLILAEKDRTDIFILDHVHYVDRGPGSENEQLEQLTKTIRQLVLDVGKPIISIAHFRKKQTGGRAPLFPTLDDFHGTSNLVKIATACILLSSAYVEELPAPNLRPTYMAVAKFRAGGACPYVARCFFDIDTGRYHDIYELGRSGESGGLWTPDDEDYAPHWAKRDKRRS